MRRTATVAICVTAMLSLSGCNLVKQALNIQNPTYSLRDIRPNVSIAIPFSASTIDFDFTIEVQNPNPVALRLDRVDFNLFVNGSQIVNGLTNDRINIPANGNGDLRIRARVGYDNIRSLFREIVDVVQGQRANYELRGRAYYNTPIGPLEFPLTVYRSGR